MDALPSSYASALFSLIEDKDTRALYADALNDLNVAMKEHPDIAAFLSSPEIGEAEKLSVLGKVYKNNGDLPHLLPFLRTIIAHHRIISFPRIVEAFSTMVNESLGVLEGYAYSSTRLTAKQLESLEKAFGKKFGKKVVLKNIVEPSLLGGVRIAINGQVYDSSLKGRLDDLRTHLKAGGNAL